MNHGNGECSLTDADVATLRTHWRGRTHTLPRTHFYRYWAARYGVAPRTIERAVKRWTYKDLP